jgi:hypothetical protein
MGKNYRIKIVAIAATAAIAALWNGCSKSGFQALTIDQSEFASGVSPINQSANYYSIQNEIIKPKCLACHNTTLSSGGVSYSDYESTLKTVVPGNPGASRMYLATSGGTMPQSGEKLTATELSNLEAWILNGARNDAPVKAPVIAGAFSPVPQPELKALTPREYDKSVQIMLGLSNGTGKATLVQTVGAPFDNDASEFIISRVHVESYEYAATKIADAFLTSPTRASYIPCVAQGATDRSCLEKFAVQLGSVAYRSLVSNAEMKPLVDLALANATEAAKFDAGLQVVIQGILQNPRFLYRFESGVLSNNLYELTAMEYLTKVTFFLLGRPPTLKEMQEVNNGAFATAASKEAYIQKLLADPGAVDQMDLIHASWMGYSELVAQDQTATDFRTETKALISKVINEGLPWTTLLTSNQTYTNGTLAKLYDLDDQTTTAWKWRTYKGDLRQGLLSQGSFLSVGVKFGDTSTTRRGYNIQKALFCGVIGHPPSVDENGKPINIDEPPPSDVVYDCKEDLYRNTVLTRKNCASCHNMMDSIAFGLENFGPNAGYRTTEPNKTQCVIKGRGEVFVMSQQGVSSLGSFTGPKQLANIALESGYIEKCLATRFSQYSMARKPTFDDEANIYNIYALQKKSTSFKDFLKSYLLSPEFSIRKGI